MYMYQTSFAGHTGREVLYNQQYSLTAENERKVLTVTKNAKFVLKYRGKMKIIPNTKKKKKTKPEFVHYKHKKGQVQPTMFRESSLKNPNLHYGHSQTVKLFMPLCSAIMGCNGHSTQKQALTDPFPDMLMHLHK